MAYKVKHLDQIKLDARFYLFDTNLWLKILMPSFSPSQQDKKYLAFFKSFSGNKVGASIVVTPLILSEIVNRYMRDYGMLYSFFKKYPEQKQRYDSLPAIEKRSFYKKEFRCHKHFIEVYNNLIDDLMAYDSLLKFENDGLGIDIHKEEILKVQAGQLDFNDNFYIAIARKRGYAIVTDDIDFFVEEVDIYTYNSALYQKAKNAVVPFVSKKGTSLADIVGKSKEAEPGE